MSAPALPASSPSSLPPLELSNIYQSTEAVLESPRESIPIYESTRWEMLDERHIRLTANVKGKLVFWVLNMKTLEKTRKFASFIIQEPRVKIYRPFINMSMQFNMGAAQGTITFDFATHANLETFKTYCEASKLLVLAGFEEKTDSSSDQKTAITYVSHPKNIWQFNTTFTEITHKLSDRFHKPDEEQDSVSQSMDGATSVAVKIMDFVTEASSIVNKGIMGAPSPFPGTKV